LKSDAGAAAEVAEGRVEFRARGEGRFELVGDLGFQSVVKALDESKSLFSKHSSIELDLAGVRRADSAGLALMLEWVNWARNNAHELRFSNIPAQIISIAQISEVEDMLYRAERWTGP